MNLDQIDHILIDRRRHSSILDVRSFRAADSDTVHYLVVVKYIVLYGCKACSLTLKEEHRLRVFENRVLRRIFGPRRDEVTADWRKLHNEELRNLYSSPNVIRMMKSKGMRWAGHVARMGETRNAYKILVEKPEGKRPLGRPRRR
jgi:hypothetical protein